MSKAAMECPGCGLAATRKNGRDRHGRQIHQCRCCHRRSTLLNASPFSGYRFPPNVIALAVRWYLRFRLS
jgi:IS6 family transposase